MPNGLGSLGRQDAALLAAAFSSTALWLVVTAAIFLARRPREPPAGPKTLELGPEPPAIAGFLAGGFRVAARSVPATLLDLAARRLVEIEQRQPGVYVVRLRDTPGEGLAAYERRVLTLLRNRQSGGFVPAEALTTGAGEASGRWWRSFRNEVVADARGRGLCRDLWDVRTLIALAVPAAVPGPLIGAALGSDPALGYFAAAAGLLVALRARGRQRDTPAGRATASRWLGVRAELVENEVFPTLPPIAVALWERHLAYGAALGVASGAIRPLPMGAESDREAWSAYGGNWREVHVSYPAVLPLGWGLHPLAAFWRGLLVAAAAGVLVYVLAPLASVDTTARAVVSGVLVAGPGFALVAGLIVAARALRSARTGPGRHRHPYAAAALPPLDHAFHAAGSMFAFSRNRFVGSYLRLSSRRRS